MRSLGHLELCIVMVLSMPCDSASKFERTRITNINSNSAALPTTTPASADTIGGGVDNSCLPPLSEDMEVTERLLPRTDDSNGKSQFFIGASLTSI